MNLFGTQRVSKGSVEETVAMVETYYRDRGLEVAEHRLSHSDGSGYWLTEGSAKIYIIVQDSPHGAILRITSPLVFIPKKDRESFYRRLLDINSNLNNCALGTHEDIVLVVTQRPTLGLVQEELDELVWHVAYVADLLDDKLAGEFGLKMYSPNADQSSNIR